MEKIKWHRLFGLTLTDLLTDSAYQVELEKEVSLKKQFRLYAVSTRYPSKLLSSKLKFDEIQQGVFDLIWGDRTIRLIVLNQIERIERNAFWLLFSGKADEFVYANQHYQWHCPTERAVLNQLYEWYKHKGVVMPYTMEDFTKDFTKEHLHLLPPLERLEGLPSETVFSQFSTEERLKGLPIEEIVAYLEKLKK